ncbi:Predicted house-cleaning noncanonical NTP pyrophosphatase, all-alpha NTP-PPase (MazG) superfamily [Evansella caseinilytica]|uniref:Predicted house-cleaning noncanonical NTP pyrophosphatase, all-alpha NTP-PPase (MazG) superfamily n=1 Tax=Evansella caseinilytica TaxID=1503961 RepID=A0A1H3GWW6_9BACI|nr:nucleoside triphosphate pyrophosphohydrolase [Evansella caseinilytica]SDY07475.1 Predicted house-cleaning noncanonical NTP pyrophosphatase, all-alpha NTP-PPase (MazG) superfamily [Evansella caseinilytica]
MPVYQKLVRDRIPEIIRRNGSECDVRRLDAGEFEMEAKMKLQEELGEYLEAGNAEQAMEELADLLELIYCLSEHHGYSKEELEHIRSDKAERRGSFYERWYLERVSD